MSKNTDVYYFSGFYLSECVVYLIITKKENLFITDKKFYKQFYLEVRNFELLKYKKSINLTLRSFLKDKNFRKIALDFQNISYSLFVDVELYKYKFLFDNAKYTKNLRSVKDKNEIGYIKKAINISIKSFNDMLNIIKPGITEIQIKNYLEYCMEKYGYTGIAFPTIVASGKTNGALPHCIPSNRKIKKGDLITIDFGAKFNNYCSDITRTIAIGNVSDNVKNIYNLVLKIKKIA